VLPLLLDGADGPTRRRVVEAIANGLTHASDESPEYTVLGIRRYLWERDDNLGLHALLAFCSSRRLIDGVLAKWEENALGNAWRV